MKTVMERSKIALHKWLQAFHLMCSPARRASRAHQLHRTLDITYEAAWFMAHRIREAMRAGGLSAAWWRRQDRRGGRNLLRRRSTGLVLRAKQQGRIRGQTAGSGNKRPIIALVERGGSVRTFHVPVADKANVTKIVRENIARETPTAHGRKQALYRLGKAFRRARNRQTQR